MKPILAHPLEESDLDNLRYPLYLSAKFDGIRCIVMAGKVLSRTLKPIPNQWIQECLGHLAPDIVWDGELLLHHTKDYNSVQSAVMSRDGRPNFYYKVFDCVVDKKNWGMPYKNRELWLRQLLHFGPGLVCLDYTRTTTQHIVKDKEAILSFEAMYLEQGYEGIVLRSPDAPYKFGRSTFNEQYLMKFKRFDDAEAEILDCIELEHNLNRPQLDERGYTKRSSHQHNKHSSGMLGAFKVRGLNGRWKGKVFSVSCGSMTHEQRRYYWQQWDKDCELHTSALLLKKLTYKFAVSRGTTESPADAVFKAFVL